MTQPLLSARDLKVEFASDEAVTTAVRGIDFDINAGETTAIVGESGSGKSVTALAIMRLIEREGGRITRGGMLFRRRDGSIADLMTLDDPGLRKLRGNEMSMIFQEPMTSLNPVLPIGEQLGEVVRLHQGRTRREALAIARDMLDRVRIPDAARRLTQYPHELSGGMRQRIMIAMALFCRPSLLIADEPTTALDVTIQREILELIRSLKDEIGMAVLLITHDMGVVAELADRVLVMRHGRIVEAEPVGPLFATPRHPYTQALLAAVPRLGDGSPARPPKAGEPVLEVRDLAKRFPVRKGLLRRMHGHVHAVDTVSFSLAAGETLGLVGESGCGKSTIGRTLMKLLEPSAGTIRIGGRDVTALPPRAMRPVRRDIQMIFQDPYASLNPRLSVVENVTEPLAIHFPDMSRRERRERAATLLQQVGMADDHLDRYPHQFSGGQRQRLCIARALCLEPRIIVADEPVSALDVSVQAQVLELMRDLQRSMGLAYLFISHDMAVVERMSHRVAVMYLGGIVEIGPAESVLRDPRHPYTRKLLASVPVADPARRRPMAPVESREIPSPFRPIGAPRHRRALTAVAPGHYVLES